MLHKGNFYKFIKVILTLMLFFLPLLTIFSKHSYAIDEPIEGWLSADKDYAIASHISFVDSGKVYIVAGATNTTSQHILYADLKQNGGIGDWVISQNDFPEKTLYHSIAKFNDFYYILGGADSLNQNSLSSIYISRPDQEIRDVWTKSETSLPKELFSGGALTINDNLYYIGGATKYNGNTTFKNSVFINKIQSDGTLNNNWKSTLPLNNEQPWVGFSPVFTGSRIILVGGKDKNNIASNKVYEGIVAMNTGEIDLWQETHSLPTDDFVSFNGVKVIKVGKYIIAIGGTVWDADYNRTNSDIVYFTDINSDGSINPWNKSVHKLPYNTCCGSLVSNKNYLYYIGGFSVDLGGYHDRIFYSKHNIDVEPYEFSLDVEYQGQIDPSWEHFEYDSASTWFASNPSIGKWGCALTSASMVLNYFSHPTNPKLLNDWLLSQPDGFIRNGLVNWLAISRYTKLHKNSNNSILEFNRFEANNVTLKNELNNNRPAIVKVPGHFVVVKGFNENDFLINDPASKTRNSLTQTEDFFKGGYSHINSFTPSLTDLSYIMLVINENQSIYIYDTYNNLINNSVFHETTIFDPSNRDPLNNESLNIFLYPKPKIGKYNLNIIGDGDYNLDVYFYNKNGDVTIEKISEFHTKDEPKNYSLFLNEDISFILPQDTLDIFKLIKKDVINNCNLGSIIFKIRCSFINRLISRAYSYYYWGRFNISKVLINYSIRYLSIFAPRHPESNYFKLLQKQLEILYKSI